MICQVCKEKKLSSEFPSEVLTKECSHHHLLVCLRCSIEAVDKQGACPVKGCGEPVDREDCIAYYSNKVKLHQIVYDYRSRERELASASSAPSSGPLSFKVTMLTGEVIDVNGEKLKTVLAVKEFLSKAISERPQARTIKLLLSGQELNDSMSLASAGVRNGSTLRAVIRLFEVSVDLDRIIFTMSWGWNRHLPRGRVPTDYLDTICLTFNKSPRGRPVYLHSIDFRTTARDNPIANFIKDSYQDVIEHLGMSKHDVNSRRSASSFMVSVQGLQNCRVQQGIPPRAPQDPRHRGRQARPRMVLPVTHVFFAYLTFRDTDVGNFPDRRLDLYDLKDPSTPLCEAEFHLAAKGLLLCVLLQRNGKWVIERIGVPLSEGNVANVRPIVDQCMDILKRNE